MTLEKERATAPSVKHSALSELASGESGVVADFAGAAGDGAKKSLRLAEMGIVPGTEITVLRRAPLGDPIEISLRGYCLSLRASDAASIPMRRGICAHTYNRRSPNKRLRVGEKLAPKCAGGDVSPVKGTIRAALVGNQNCGKTTLFNAVSGSDRRVGNFPGVTVDIGRGRALAKFCAEDVELVDLPGIYSLTPYSDDERLTVENLVNDPPDVIVNVVDATTPARGLYLTSCLSNLRIPLVLALNMADEVERSGGSVDAELMGQMLGVRAVKISAARGDGLDALLASVVESSKDSRAKRGAQASPKARVGTPCAAEAAEKYALVDEICRRCVSEPNGEQKKRRMQGGADRLALGKYTSYPLFFAVMACIFFLTFNVADKYAGSFCASAADAASSFLARVMEDAGVHPMLQRLVCEGALSGIGAVISFLPVVVTLYFLLSVLEDTGYMARAAFIMDAPMRKLGLSGKSVVPLLLGFGCSVPAISASRTLPTERDRHLTVRLVPYMMCGAKIPVAAMISESFFPGHASSVIFAFYAGGVLTAAVYAFFCRKLSRDAPSAEYMLELPAWRLPTARSVFKLVRRRTSEFLSRTFGVIFLSSVAVWALSAFTPELSAAVSEDESILAVLGHAAAPVFTPLGFGDWRAAASLVAGLSAKEAVVGTLAVLLGRGGAEGLFTPASALSFLTFTMFYTPCAAAVSAMRTELGSARKTAFALLVNFAVAYALSAAVYAAANALF